jgi:hypothetical protein
MMRLADKTKYKDADGDKQLSVIYWKNHLRAVRH